MDFDMTELFGQDENGHLHVHMDCHYRPSELKSIMTRKATAVLTRRTPDTYSRLMPIKILDCMDITENNAVPVRWATGTYRPMEYDVAFRVMMAAEPLIKGTMLVSRKYADIDLSLDLIPCTKDPNGDNHILLALRRLFNRVMMGDCDRENIPF